MGQKVLWTWLKPQSSSKKNEKCFLFKLSKPMSAIKRFTQPPVSPPAFYQCNFLMSSLWARKKRNKLCSNGSPLIAWMAVSHRPRLRWNIPLDMMMNKSTTNHSSAVNIITSNFRHNKFETRLTFKLRFFTRFVLSNEVIKFAFFAFRRSFLCGHSSQRRVLGSFFIICSRPSERDRLKRVYLNAGNYVRYTLNELFISRRRKRR